MSCISFLTSPNPGSQLSPLHPAGIPDPNYVCLYCCICIAPIIKDANEEYQSSGSSSLSFSSDREICSIKSELIFRILDIHPEEKTEKDEKKFPVCKPCYIEISKYEKLLNEIQRIVHQILTSVLEHFESKFLPLPHGESLSINEEALNPIYCLKDVILQRWKSKPVEHDISHDELSSSVLKSIYQDLNDHHEVLISSETSKQSHASMEIQATDNSDIRTPVEGEKVNLKELNTFETVVDPKGHFNCNKCKKEFRQKRDLDVHIRQIHTKEKPFICDSCGKSYSAKSTLYHHQKVHSQRFVCDICGDAFVTETGLKKHLTIHKGVKEFQCEICSKQFMWKQSLMRHTKLHDGNQSSFCCQFCNRSFLIKDYLDKHIHRRHAEVKGEKLNCNFCKHSFLTPGKLSAHILRKHSSTSASFL